MTTKYAYIPSDRKEEGPVMGLMNWMWPLDIVDFKKEGTDVLAFSDEELEEMNLYKIGNSPLPDPDFSNNRLYLSDLIHYNQVIGFHREWQFRVNLGEIDMEEAEILEVNRFSRNRLLQISDYTQATDSPVTDAKKIEWATYRQALRDLPTSLSTFNSEIVNDENWPTKPL